MWIELLKSAAIAAPLSLLICKLIDAARPSDSRASSQPTEAMNVKIDADGKQSTTPADPAHSLLKGPRNSSRPGTIIAPSGEVGRPFRVGFAAVTLLAYYTTYDGSSDTHSAYHACRNGATAPHCIEDSLKAVSAFVIVAIIAVSGPAMIQHSLVELLEAMTEAKTGSIAATIPLFSKPAQARSR
jgi:hypothetical protein